MAGYYNNVNPQQQQQQQQNPMQGGMNPMQGNMQMMNQQNVQPLFPQPTGNVYNINSTLEVANVPVGAGVSVAICWPENVMYLKTMQNGNPLFYPYKIIPFSNEAQDEKNNSQQQQQVDNSAISQLTEQLKACIAKVNSLEAKINGEKKGSEFNL